MSCQLDTAGAPAPRGDATPQKSLQFAVCCFEMGSLQVTQPVPVSYSLASRQAREGIVTPFDWGD